MMANSKKTNWTIATVCGGIVLVGSTITASGKIDTLLHGDLAPVAELRSAERAIISNRQFASENRLNVLNIMLDRKQELLARINLAISTDGNNAALQASKQDIESSIRLIVGSITKLGGA